jgi:signal transduction histidine kinase
LSAWSFPRAKHAHVSWECESPPDDRDFTVANAHSVRAGLLNLVLNAVQAAGSGGHVRLWTDRTRTHVQIHVSDSGSGPPESLQSAMFEPFITSKPEGIGLGLALAKAAAEEHGGSLTFARPDGQTRFTMSLAAGHSEQMPAPRDENTSKVPVAAGSHSETRLAAERLLRD